MGNGNYVMCNRWGIDSIIPFDVDVYRKKIFIGGLNLGYNLNQG